MRVLARHSWAVFDDGRSRGLDRVQNLDELCRNRLPPSARRQRPVRPCRSGAGIEPKTSRQLNIVENIAAPYISPAGLVNAIALHALDEGREHQLFVEA